MKKIIVIVSAFLLISCNQEGDHPGVSTNPVSLSNTKIDMIWNVGKPSFGHPGQMVLIRNLSSRMLDHGK